jgi:hypothetical protein
MPGSNTTKFSFLTFLYKVSVMINVYSLHPPSSFVCIPSTSKLNSAAELTRRSAKALGALDVGGETLSFCVFVRGG